jgi:hypothetical protein
MNPSLFPFFAFDFSTNRKRIALAIYLFLTTLVIYAAFSNWAYDDPFITYRYAANLQHGLGFVYNLGERVQSTTTPLFALLLALLRNLWPDLPHLANLLGAFSLALGALFLWDLAHTWQAPFVGWCGLLLYPTFPLLVSTLGSETPLYLAFCLGAFAFYARHRCSLTAACVALAILTRPDGILVAFILAVHYFLFIRRPIPWLALALFLGLTVPWFVFAWAYFGSPLPATLAVKQHQGAMAISQRFAPGLVTIFREYVRWPYLLEAGLAVVGMACMFRRARSWALFLAWTLLYFLAYSFLGVSRYFWYYAPLMPGLLALLGLGISCIRKIFPSGRTISYNGDHSINNPAPIPPPLFSSGKGEKGEIGDLNARSLRKSPISLSSYRSRPLGVERAGIYRTLSNILLVASLLLLVLAQAVDLWQLRKHPDNRMVIYEVVGEWLRDHTPHDASVGTLEVGLIGYYSQRRMIDFAGLIQPQVSNQLTEQSSYEDAALWAVEHFLPNYLVLQKNIFPRLEQGYVVLHCKAIQYFPGNAYGYSTDINVYTCK